jgi:DNA-binding beta-propeller fold protein YncE
MTRSRVVLALVLAVAGLCSGVSRASAALPVGELQQLAGTAGCFTFNGTSEEGTLTCGAGLGLARPESAAVSPDGQNVYVGSYNGTTPTRQPSLAVFLRSTTTGQLTQLAGPAGCLTPDGSSIAGPGTCTAARGLRIFAGDGRDVAFSSDGTLVYLTAQNNSPVTGDILIFRRDLSTGALTQLPGTAGCISSDGSSQDGPATCQTDAQLDSPMGITMNSDQRFMYVTDYGHPNRIHVYSRDSAGTLTAIQCLAEAPAPAGCTPGRVLGNSQSLVIAPDGQHAYGGDYQQGMSVFDRDPVTGLLTQKPGAAACITDDGKDNTGAATCATGRSMNGSYPISISPDGHSLYNAAGGDRSVTVWHINADGTLSQLAGTDGCLTSDGKDNTGAATCGIARNVSSAYGTAISPDGRNLYVSHDSNPGGGIAVFSLDAASGRATQLAGLAGCWSSDGTADETVAGSCSNGRALAEGYGMSISPDGAWLYQATVRSLNAGLAIYSRGVAPVCQAASADVRHGKATALALPCADANGDPLTRSIVSGPAHGTLGAIDAATGAVVYTPAASYSGPDSFTFAASDGPNASAPAGVTINVGKRFRGARLRSRVLIVDSKGNFKLRISCPADAPSGRCSNVASLYTAAGSIPRSAKARKKHRRAALLARSRFSVKAGGSVTKKVHLDRAGRKLAKHHRHFRARLRLRSTSGAGTAVRQTINVTLKHAKVRKHHKH